MFANNKVNPEDIQALIASETFTILPSGRVMVCEITLTTGMVCTGKASVADKANFDQAKGEEVSRRRAIDEVYMVAGVLLFAKMNSTDSKLNVPSLTIEQVKALGWTDLAYFSEDQMRQFTVEQLAALSEKQIAALSIRQRQALSPEQWEALQHPNVPVTADVDNAAATAATIPAVEGGTDEQSGQPDQATGDAGTSQ